MTVIKFYTAYTKYVAQFSFVLVFLSCHGSRLSVVVMDCKVV